MTVGITVVVFHKTCDNRDCTVALHPYDQTDRDGRNHYAPTAAVPMVSFSVWFAFIFRPSLYLSARP